MARTKVSDADLREHLERGHSQADAARHFGVSEPAIHQRLKRRRGFTARVVAREKAGEVVEQKLTAAQRLQRVQDVILDQLTWAESQATQAGADRPARGPGQALGRGARPAPPGARHQPDAD